MYFSIKTFDYADEFDYPVSVVLTKSNVEFVKLIQETVDKYELNEGYDEYYFGTNEYLEFDLQTIIDMILSAEELSDDEIKVLAKFGIPNMALNIAKSLQQRIYWEINDNVGDEEAEEFAKVALGYFE